MQVETQVREFREDDYDAVLALWRQSAGVEVAEGDDRSTIAAYLRRNPGLSQVAVHADRVVGAVLCGHDGRRGVLYHLAVAPAFRGHGLARRLVSQCLAGLRTCGVPRVLLLVSADNSRGREFWLNQGFDEISGAMLLGRDLL